MLPSSYAAAGKRCRKRGVGTDGRLVEYEVAPTTVFNTICNYRPYANMRRYM